MEAENNKCLLLTGPSQETDEKGTNGWAAFDGNNVSLSFGLGHEAVDLKLKSSSAQMKTFSFRTRHVYSYRKIAHRFR